MRNTTDTITKGNDIIHIIGIDDPAQVNESYAEQGIVEEAIVNSMEGLEEGSFKILLAHRPEMLSLCGIWI